MARQKPSSAANFAPELLALLIAGSEKSVTIKVENRKRAFRLAFRLNDLRVAMRKQGHPQLPVVEGVQVTKAPQIPQTPGFTNENVPWTVTVAPADDDFAQAIRKAGIDVANVMPLTLIDPDTLPTPEDGEGPIELDDDEFFSFLKK